VASNTIKNGPFKGRAPKCKFYPKECAKGNECPFNHPPPCLKFPNCKFGESCMFVHTLCERGDLCQLKNCHYAHKLTYEGRIAATNSYLGLINKPVRPIPIQMPTSPLPVSSLPPPMSPPPQPPKSIQKQESSPPPAPRKPAN
jgi:hypothetical protein